VEALDRPARVRLVRERRLESTPSCARITSAGANQPQTTSLHRSPGQYRDAHIRVTENSPYYGGSHAWGLG
jgi:hypothetical protein